MTWTRIENPSSQWSCRNCYLWQPGGVRASKWTNGQEDLCGDCYQKMATNPVPGPGFPVATPESRQLNQIAHKLRQINAAIAAAQQQIHNLETAGICCATPYWRTLKSGARSLYAIHPDRSQCPLHGHSPDHAGRIKTYIGADLDAQEPALAAIQRWQTWRQLDRRAQILQRAARRIAGGIAQLLIDCNSALDTAKGTQND